MNNNDTIKKFIDLYAWQKGHRLVIQIYLITKTFPKSELFGLSSQMRRAVVSVTSNIAEGFTRISDIEKIRFYNISLSSLTELQNQLYVSKDVGYITSASFNALLALSVEVHKIITGLIKSTKARRGS